MTGPGTLLGIDVGGTSVKVCLLDEDGRKIASYATPTCPLDNEQACSQLARQLGAYVRQQQTRCADIEAVGVAIPGPMRGMNVEMMPNASLDLPLLLEHVRDVFANAGLAGINDANAAAYAESRVGHARGADSALFVCLGTGIGAGYTIGGKFVAGHNGACGEIGHMKVVKGGRRCGCGASGCLEQYASARGLVRTFREVDANNPALYADLGGRGKSEVAGLRPKHGTDAVTVFRAFELGDARALHAVDVFCKTLGWTLAQVSSVLDPQMILLGGGLAGSFDLYAEQLTGQYRAHAIGPCRETPVVRSRLGRDAGALGAALFAREHGA